MRFGADVLLGSLDREEEEVHFDYEYASSSRKAHWRWEREGGLRDEVQLCRYWDFCEVLVRRFELVHPSTCESDYT